MTIASFPLDWLDPSSLGPSGPVAGDLDLVVLLVNTVDLLEPAPDRLTDLAWLRSALRRVGQSQLATELRAPDLQPLRALRADLRAVFECADSGRLPQLLNPMLERWRAVPLLVEEPSGRLQLAVAPERKGLAALQARLPSALAAHVAQHGLHRLGTCAGNPCRCAFVDRTRGATRRYCCGYCNDRTAARAYRKRRKAP